MRLLLFFSQSIAQWTYAYLAEAAGDYCADWPVQCSAPAVHRFVPVDESEGRNLRAAPYFIREPETQLLAMSVRSFVQCSSRWTTRPVRLYAIVMDEAPPPNEAEGSGPAPATDPAAPPAVSPKLGRAAARDLRLGVAWGQLAAFLAEARRGGVRRVRLDCGSRGGLLPAMQQPDDRLIAQVAGRCRVLVIPPEATFAGMYPYPHAHPYRRQSMLDLGALDLGRWPAAAGLRGAEAVLAPGDVLVVPAWWWVHAELLEPECVALEMELYPSRRAALPARAVPAALGEALEARLAEAEGARHVRRWLQLIARGAEMEEIDLNTVQARDRPRLRATPNTLGVGRLNPGYRG